METTAPQISSPTMNCSPSMARMMFSQNRLARPLRRRMIHFPPLRLDSSWQGGKVSVRQTLTLWETPTPAPGAWENPEGAREPAPGPRWGRSQQNPYQRCLTNISVLHRCVCGLEAPPTWRCYQTGQKRRIPPTWV